MKCQIKFSRKNKKNIISLHMSPTEIVLNKVSVKDKYPMYSDASTPYHTCSKT